MDARPLGIFDGFPALVDIRGHGARQASDDGPPNLAGDALDSREVVRARGRKAGLDHVDAETGELVGHLNLLRRRQGEAWRLLAVTQSGVEDLYVVGHGATPSWL